MSHLTADEHRQAQKIAYFKSLARGNGVDPPPYNDEFAAADFWQAASDVIAQRAQMGAAHRLARLLRDAWKWYWSGTPELVTAKATALLTILTAIGLIITVYIARDAIKEQEKITSTTLLVSLEERWTSERMEASRKKLAGQLLAILDKKSSAPQRSMRWRQSPSIFLKT